MASATRCQERRDGMRREQNAGGPRREPTLKRGPVATVRVLFVCLGNICRSPTAEAVFRQHVKAAGLEQRIEIDSAGTGNYQIGKPPDLRACSAAAKRGYDLTARRARQVRLSDFYDFDYVLAMDEANLEALKRLCPPEHVDKLGLLTDFSSTRRARDYRSLWRRGRRLRTRARPGRRLGAWTAPDAHAPARSPGRKRDLKSRLQPGR